MGFPSAFLIPDRFFSPTSASVFFYRSNAFIDVRPIAIEAAHQQSPTSIMLTNGVKYDPFQTYDAPQTPQTFVAAATILPRPNLSSSALSIIEGEIGGWVDTTISYIGIRATFYAYSGYNQLYTCTARMIGVSFKPYHEQPRQIPAGMGGPGSSTAGLKGGQISCTFDQLTNWVAT